MKKANKILMAAVAILLSLVLISTSVLSGVFAKFVITDKADISVGFTKWGITIDAGSDIASASINTNASGASVSTNLVDYLAPGTHGCIFWFKVEADNPEVDFKIDFEGEAEIGDGYTAASKLIRGEDGKPVEYFPIVFYLVAYDLNSDGTINRVVTDTNDKGKIMDYTIGDRNSNEDGVVKHDEDNQVFSFKTFTNIQKQFNNNYNDNDFEAGSLTNVFDQTFTVDSTTGKVASFDRVYTLQWCWPYNDKDNTYPKHEYKQGTYQTQWLDTQLGEAILKDTTNSRFNIKFDMSVNIMQVQ